jgi:hypothetical protein
MHGSDRRLDQGGVIAQRVCARFPFARPRPTRYRHAFIEPRKSWLRPVLIDSNGGNHPIVAGAPTRP